ncbi:host cell division inhibitor Icd-like protein [Salmonella enterica]|nr:host cell division inhibitor Icd-like protein [Salmonella enterica]ECB2071592.1 host cell division inhibitor Icd-like protein [Salmonella enterica subsp. enterica serovar Benin]MKU01535.1 host cell division inhibitor Icd-like protein [Salmonella enterica subsp. enterica serovar Kinondoni]EBE6989130.1 host cell division inhibitor Icd-like protein [Salmonella enterica]EBE7297910.1 host cell division inhibitor Icd-like protein [Salmonella enterica]
MDKNRLPVCVAGLYIPCVAPHRATGFSSLNRIAGSRLISVKRYFYARNPSCNRIMAGCDGEALAPAGSYSASLLTPSRLATPFSSEVARLQKFRIGVPAMVNASPCPYPLFIWRFFSGQNSTYLTTTAASEHEARLQLPAVRLVFAARIRLKGIHHA